MVAFNPNKPWQLRYRMAKPTDTGQRVVNTAYASKESALHEGERVMELGAISATVINPTLSAPRRIVKTWTSDAPRVRKRHQR